MKLSIIIPAYNEEQSIASIIERTLAARSVITAKTPITSVEVIIVNDGSKDKTPDIAKGYKDITLITYQKNKGYGAAIKLGFAQAHGDLLGFLDADGTCDPLFFVTLINSLLKKNADIAIGSRLGPESKMPKIRRIGNKIYAVIINFLANVTITDSASGMRIIKQSTLHKLYPLPDGLHFTPAMSCKALMNHELKIIEEPMSYQEREGRSKLNIINDGIRFLKTIAEVALYYKPLKVFFTSGMVLIVISFLYSLYPIFFYLKHHRIEEWFIYRLISILVFSLVGLNFIVFGLFADKFVAIINNQESAIDRINNKLFCWILEPWNIFKIGLFISFLGIALNIKTIHQYITLGHIYVHWVYVLTGAVLILSGMVVFTFGFLHKILDMYKERRDYLNQSHK